MRRKIVLTLHLWREEGQWLGECAELGTATFGSSTEEVLEELKDLVLLHVKTMAVAGQLETILAERGVTVYEEDEGPEASVLVSPPSALFQSQSSPDRQSWLQFLPVSSVTEQPSLVAV